MLERTLAVLAALAPLTACGLDGAEGFFVQLYGRVVTEHDDPAAGLEVSVASAEGAALLETTTDDDGWYSLVVLVTERTGHGLRLRIEGEGYSTTLAWVSVELDEGEVLPMPSHPPQLWSTWTRQLPPMQVALDASDGQAEGIIVDAWTGEPAMDDQGGVEAPLELELELREGWNAPDSEAVVKTVTTGQGALLGRFVVGGIEPGLYTARVPGTSGFTAARFPLLVRSTTTQEVRATITQALASDEIRASLVWSDTPADLNLHVTGPRASVTTGESQWERFHVWADEPYHPANASDIHDRVVTMDLTADDAHGPESITVQELYANGDYRFSVYDHGNASSSDSDALSWSRALVQLWIGTREPLFFEVTPGQQGNLWTVATWDSQSDRVYGYQESDSEDDEFDAEVF